MKDNALGCQCIRAWCDAHGVKDATENMAIEMLTDLLLRFVMEARRQDETPYPPATLMHAASCGNTASLL